jgi:di/tricarboxylate transporter
MGWEAWVTVVTIVLMLYALARNLAGPDVVLTGGMVLLMTLGAFSGGPGSTAYKPGDAYLPSPSDMARGYGNEALLTVAVLFVMAAGLSETGALQLITDRVLGRPKSVIDAQVRMTLPVAASSAFLNNTTIVAMFVPIIHDWCKRIGLSPSKLFIPLSYAAVLGGVCTLIGTSTNLVVRGLMIEAHRTDPNMPILGMWTLTPVGVPVALLGLAFIIIAGRKLLPDRQSASAATLEDPRQYTVEMTVAARGPVDGQTIEKAGLRHLQGVYLVEIDRDGELIAAPGPETILRGNDRLIFVGVVDSVVDLQKMRGLLPATNQVFKLREPRVRRRLVEAVVSNVHPLVGKTIREGRFRTKYEAAVIAVHRNGARVDRKIGDIELHAGDTLLLEAPPGFSERHRNSRDFYLVSDVEGSTPVRHDKAWIALAVMVGLIGVFTLESVLSVSLFNAAILAAGLMVLTRCCSPEQARRSIDWPTLVAIGASFGIGKAMETSGAALAMANGMQLLVGKTNPWLMLAAIYLLTLIFTEVVTNNAAAVLAFPIARLAAANLGVDFLPFAVVIAIAASAGFATPLGYQTHLMVYGPGGYRFSDYLKIGIPLDLMCMVVAVVVTPMVFPFRAA